MAFIGRVFSRGNVMQLTADVLVTLLESDLYASGWDGSTTPDLGCTASQYAMKSLRNSIVKKFHNNEMSEPIKQLTLDTFLSSNAACEKYIPFGQLAQTQSWDLELYNDIREILHRFCLAPQGDSYGGTNFPILDLRSIFQNGDLGPGASIGAKESSFYAKMTEAPLTATSDLLIAYYDEATRYLPLWRASEAKRRKRFGTRVCSGSRLNFVPKSAKIARTICTEPILNMFFQLGIGNVIRQRLKVFFGIDLSDQPVTNAHLAHFGSMTNGFATIDLKNASDTISCSLVYDLFPREFLRWLDISRSPTTTLPSGEIVQLHMISSMGNGFTFPLQTLIFAAVVKAVYSQLGFSATGSSRTGTQNFGVYGDDIVVDSRAYHRVCYALNMLGFTVNLDKSFYIGDFRESCGRDFYYGHDVRGVYIAKLCHELDFLSAFNRLVRWSVRWRIPLDRLLAALRKGFRFLPVPLDESDIAGVKVPSTMAPVYEHGNLKKAQRKAKDAGLFVYRFNKVIQRSRDLTREGASEDTCEGAFLTLLADRLKNGRVYLRSDSVKTITKVAVTPRWDYDGNRVLTDSEGKFWQELILRAL